MRLAVLVVQLSLLLVSSSIVSAQIFPEVAMPPRHNEGSHYPMPPAPAPSPHHHHHHHHHPHPPTPPPTKPPTHPPVYPPPKAPTQPPPKPPVYPPPKAPTPPPVHPPPKPPVQPPVKPPTHAPPKPPVHPPPTYSPPKPPVRPPTKPPTPPPVKPPMHPPSHPPAKPPSYPKPPRSLVAVQGVVYCKSCKYAGVDTLLGAKPVSGAVVKLTCRNTKYKLVVQDETDKNGYFFIEAPKNITSYGAHKCTASLVSSPLASCRKPSNLHDGLQGATLRPQKPYVSKNLQFLLYSVGPFAFEPKCY